MSRGCSRRALAALVAQSVSACTGMLEEPSGAGRDAGHVSHVDAAADAGTSPALLDAAAGGLGADAADWPPAPDAGASHLDAGAAEQEDSGGGPIGGAAGMTQPHTGGNEADAGGGAGAGGAEAGGGGAGGAGRSCDGVAPAPGHPAFAAIKRLATTQTEVRVLVYGQSISEQAWWRQTRDWLRETYPDGQLVMEEHALGGCSSQCLIGHERYYADGSRFNRLPQDVFAWKPDLILFHVYGDHVDYGYIMRGFSEGCAAFDEYRTEMGEDVPEVHCTSEQRALAEGYRKPEVLVQGDFLIARDEHPCEQPPSKQDWECFMNAGVIPEQVARFDYAYQDNYREFPRYIAAHQLDPKTLIMPDDTHLSEPHGTDVMFALTIPHLCYVPER